MNARGVKGKPKKRKPTKPDNPAQSERFVKAAKELGLDGTGQDFERAMQAIIRRKPTNPKK